MISVTMGLLYLPLLRAEPWRRERWPPAQASNRKMADLYWVPTSGPCLLGVVGSWFSQNTFSRSSYDTRSRVVYHLDHFRVPGPAGANVAVRGFW